MVPATIRVLGGGGSLLNCAVWLVVESPLKLLGSVGAWGLVLVYLGSCSRLYQVAMLLRRAVA